MLAVHTHIAGSHCVVQMREDWELYIDARASVRDDLSHIEVVRSGQVRQRVTCPNTKAPEHIVALIKELQ